MMIAYHTKKRFYDTIMIFIMIIMIEYNIMIRIRRYPDIKFNISYDDDC